MATVTLDDLIANVREIANVQNSRFVKDDELTKRINEAISELYDLILSVYEDYFVTYTANFTIVGGQGNNSVALASVCTSFYKDNSLEWNPGTSNMRLVRRLPSDLERDARSVRSYEIVGTPAILYVYPPEQSAGTYRLKYTPDAPTLVNGTDALDSTLAKWYEYVQIRAAIAVHRKRQKLEDAALLAGDEGNPQPGTLAHVRRNVLSLAKNRQSQPQQVPLGRRRSSFWDWDDNP